MAEQPRNDRVRRWPLVWRLLTLGVVTVGVASVWRASPASVSATGRPRTPPSPEALKYGFEPKDISARGLTFVLAAMAAATALVIGVVFLMVWRFDVAGRQASFVTKPQQTARIEPPAPHLQRDPFADLARLRAREDRTLHSYGWTSPDHDTARIPIDRAMALSVGKSLDAGP